MNSGGPRSIPRTVAVVACFGLLLVVPHVRRRESALIDGIAREGKRARAGDLSDSIRLFVGSLRTRLKVYAFRFLVDTEFFNGQNLVLCINASD